METTCQGQRFGLGEHALLRWARAETHCSYGNALLRGARADTPCEGGPGWARLVRVGHLARMKTACPQI